MFLLLSTRICDLYFKQINEILYKMTDIHYNVLLMFNIEKEVKFWAF